MRKKISILAFLLFLNVLSFAFDLSRATIVLPENPLESSKLAAEELSTYVGKISGSGLPLVTGQCNSPIQVIIGTVATLKDIPAEASQALAAAKQKEGYCIQVRGDKMYIVGTDETGELYGTYQFMEDKLGIRWLKAANPNDPGEYIPQNAPLVIADYEKFREPHFFWRVLDQCGSFGNVIPVNGKTWAYRNGFQAPVPYNGCIDYDKPESARYKFYAPRIPRYYIDFGGTHMTFAGPAPASKYFDEHPEYFALIDGKRVKGEQYCISNHELQKLVADDIIAKLDKFHGKGFITMGMVDVNDGWCECENCRALDDGDTFADGFQNVSTRFQTVVKRIAGMVYAKYPDADLRTWAYHTYRQIPQGSTLDPRLRLMYCIHGRCYGHSLDDPNCPFNSKFYKSVNDWLQIAKEVYIYEYGFCSDNYYNCQENVLAHDLRLYKKLAVTGWKEEAIFEDSKLYPPRSNDPRVDLFPSNWLYLYVAGKLLWDPTLDENEIIADAERCYYGKTYSVMEKYQRLRRKLWNNSSQCMGYPRADGRRPHILNVPNSREELLGYLDDAELLAAGDEVLTYRIGRDRYWLQTYWIAPNDLLRASASSVLNAPQATSKITIDGEGDDPAWVGAQYIDTFKSATKATRAPLPDALKTTIGVLIDEENFYFLITALEPTPDKMKLTTGHDSRVWDDDGCEIFLYPPTASNLYYQIAVNALGTIFDAVQPGSKTDIDLGIEVKGKIHSDRYVIEMRVPVKKMMGISRGDIWKIHFARNRRIVDQHTGMGDSDKHYSYNGIGYTDVSFFTPIQMGEPYLRNGSFDDLDAEGKPKHWFLRGATSTVIKHGSGYAVSLKDYGDVFYLLASGELGQKNFPRKLSYSFRAFGAGTVKVQFFRYTDTPNPKAKNGYTRKLQPEHGIGGNYTLADIPQMFAGEYTVKPNEWVAIDFVAKDAVVDDVSLRLEK